MLTKAIPDNGLQLYRTSYAVRSANFNNSYYIKTSIEKENVAK